MIKDLKFFSSLSMGKLMAPKASKAESSREPSGGGENGAVRDAPPGHASERIPAVLRRRQGSEGRVAPVSESVSPARAELPSAKVNPFEGQSQLQQVLKGNPAQSRHKLRWGWKYQPTATTASVVPFGGAVSQQGPADPQRKIAMKGVDAFPTQIKVPLGEAQRLAGDLDQQMRQVVEERPLAPPPSPQSKMRRARNLLTPLLGCFTGSTPTKQDRLELVPDVNINGGGVASWKAEPARSVARYMDATTALDAVKVGVDLARAVVIEPASSPSPSQTSAPSNAVTSSSTATSLADLLDPDALKTLSLHQSQVKTEARRAAENAQQDVVDHALGCHDPRYRQHIQTGLAQLGRRLKLSPDLPDALAHKVFAQAIEHRYRQAPVQEEKVLDELLTVGLRDSLTRLDTVMQTLREPTDALLLVMNDLRKLPGGMRMLSQVLAGPEGRTSPKEAELQALRVSLSAMDAMMAAGQQGGVSIAQHEWLKDAVKHALRQVGGSQTPHDEDPATRLRQQKAFTAVSNGLLSNEPGSRYDLLNTQIKSIRHQYTEVTRLRNERAAKGAWGKWANVASASMPRALGGIQTNPFRKSTLLTEVRSGIRNGLLPDRSQALSNVAAGVGEVANWLRSHRQQHARPQASVQDVAERLFFALSKHLIDSEGKVLMGEKDAKKIGSAFFSTLEQEAQVQALLGMEDQGGSGQISQTDGDHDSARGLSDFARQWQQLRQGKPNIGHVLGLLMERMDLRALAHGEAPQAVPAHQTLADKGAKLDAAARQMLESMQDMVAAVPASVKSAAATDERMAAVAVIADFAKGMSDHWLKLPVQTSLSEGLRDDSFTTVPPGVLAAFERLPVDVQAKWMQLRSTGPDAMQLMGLLHEALRMACHEAGLTDQALYQQAQRAEVTLEHWRRDMVLQWLDLSAADVVTTHADLRSTRDLSAVMHSLSARLSLGERFRATDGKTTGLAIGRLLTPVVAVPAFGLVSPVVNPRWTGERAMEMNMTGSSIQAFVGKNEAKGLSLGLRVGFSLGQALGLGGGGGGDDAKLRSRADVRWEAGVDFGQLDGVSLRVKRFSGQEDQLRRDLGSALMDMVHAPPGAPEIDGDDALGELIARHPKLAVSGFSLTTQALGGELSAQVNFGLRVHGPDNVSVETRAGVRDAVGLNVRAGMATKSSRGTSVQLESSEALQVNEFKVLGKHRVEARAGMLTPLGLFQRPDNNDTINPAQQTRLSLNWLGQHLDTSRQLANRGMESTLRITTDQGATSNVQTQLIRERETYDSFANYINETQPLWLKALADRDVTPQRSRAEKVAVAHQRLSDVLEQFHRAESDPNVVMIVVNSLKPEAAAAWDSLRALAIQATDAGRDSVAEMYRQTAAALLLHDSSWNAQNLQGKTKARYEKTVSAAANIRAAKSTGESTRLHEFVPLSAQNVGRRHTMPIAAEMPQIPPRREVPTDRPLRLERSIKAIQAELSTIAQRKLALERHLAVPPPEAGSVVIEGQQRHLEALLAQWRAWCLEQSNGFEVQKALVRAMVKVQGMAVDADGQFDISPEHAPEWARLRQLRSDIRQAKATEVQLEESIKQLQSHLAQAQAMERKGKSTNLSETHQQPWKQHLTLDQQRWADWQHQLALGSQEIEKIRAEEQNAMERLEAERSEWREMTKGHEYDDPSADTDLHSAWIQDEIDIYAELHREILAELEVERQRGHDVGTEVLPNQHDQLLRRQEEVKRMIWRRTGEQDMLG